MRDHLAAMEKNGFIEHGGSERGTFWALRPELHRRLAGPGHHERDHRIEWEAAKTRVLSILVERAKRGEEGLSKQEIRQITRFDRFKVIRLINELSQKEPRLEPAGRGRYARYAYRKAGNA